MLPLQLAVLSTAQPPCTTDCPNGPLSSLREGQNSALDHDRYYLWNHRMRRCDMQQNVFLGPHGAPGYTEGRWVPSYMERRSILEFMPMECVESTTPCPSGGCCASEIGCQQAPVTTSPTDVCASFHTPCYGTRSSATFANNLRNFAFVWQPSDGCFFSPMTHVPPTMFHAYAASIEQSAGPILFVGDTPLSELFVAFQQHTNGAAHSAFQYTNTLVNSYTLRPMTPEQVALCATGATHADSITPCPPMTPSGLPYESNTHHQLFNMYWTIPFARQVAHDAEQPLRTLVLAMGSHLWKQHPYPAVLAGCSTPAGDADAFKPFKSLNLSPSTNYGCDMFGVRYPVIVESIARHIGNALFTGHVIFVTTPPGSRGCEQLASPLAPSVVNATGELYLGVYHDYAYYSEQIKHAEIVWRTAFQKWAPRAKLSILNLTHMSATRADALIPTAAGGQHPRGACEAFCYPGMPHVWAEMLTRLLEQYHFHN
jgi:hypothetical protein